ncbi:Serralysin A precursor [Synechococcus sp. MIT S9509]|nr:Serralysin A precursor [Synechococcus sp. MIT S9509]
MIENILIWPDDDTVMQTGIETGIYGELPGRGIGAVVEVSILHLDSGRYWQPEGTFGEEMTHQGVVVADDGHWRLLMTPPTSGAYRIEVLETSSEGALPLASTEFTVIGEDLMNVFASAAATNADQINSGGGNPDRATTHAAAEEATTDNFSSAKAATRPFWEGRRGIGFSVDSQGQWLSQERLESALYEVSALGFDTIRTWGTNNYTGRILEAIDQMDLDLKVQAGIYITNESDAAQLINHALEVIQPYEQYILGFSLGNEQLADWSPSELRVNDVREQVQVFRDRSDLPITYNFAGETLRPDSSFWNQQGNKLLQELDYVNVHSYAGFFDNRSNPEWTPQKQMEVLKADESLFRSALDSLGLFDTPLILGETGWQSGGYADQVTNATNLKTYFQEVSDYIESDKAIFDSMFYFNFSDESWKGTDDDWGLFTEGNEAGLGAAKFDGVDGSKITPTIHTEAISNRRLIADSGTARLWVDDATGQAFVQKGSDEPLLIRRNDNYWVGDIPLVRDQAELVGAAVDAMGRIRVLDRGPWGDFNWILDDSGMFTGEQGPAETTNESNELLFQLDLNLDQIIGTAEEGNGDEQPNGEDADDSNDATNRRLIADSGTARLWVDDATGQAFVQKGSDEPLLIRRNDNYWVGDIPLVRDQAELVGAAVDAMGRIRVLDRGPWGDFNWILDDSGIFTGEQGPAETTNESNELLFQLDLNLDQIIGTAEEGNGDEQPSGDEQPAGEDADAFELTGFSQGEFVSNIAFSHRATADPIVAPGNAQFMHSHDFFANTSTDENSTVSSLLTAGSVAAQPTNNFSTYWTPSLINEGTDGLGGDWSYVTPKASSIAYYSVLKPNDPNLLVNMPTGLKMITGSAKPDQRQSRGEMFWNYIGESASYDHIPLGDEWRDLPLQAVIIFPDHWNGHQLDSNDHKSHLNYGSGSDAHPLLIPQLQLQIHYGRIDNTLHLVSSDYMNLPEAGSELDQRLLQASDVDLSFRNGEDGFAPGWSLHADHIHLPWEETAPNGEQVDGFARREEDALRLPLFAGTDGDAVRPIPTGISQPYSSDRAILPILGTPGENRLIGSESSDRLEALEGDDFLIGGPGSDRLIGGDGADHFILEGISDSTWDNPDEIIGFSADDRLDLSSLSLETGSIQLEQLNPSSWMLSATGTDLAVEIRTGQIGFEQILLT